MVVDEHVDPFQSRPRINDDDLGLNEGLLRINAKQIAPMMKSKCDVYRILTEEGQLYLPVSSDWWSDLGLWIVHSGISKIDPQWVKKGSGAVASCFDKSSSLWR